MDDDTDQKFRNSSHCCCFRLLRPSNRKINAISVQEDQVSRPIEQTACKLEKNPVLKEKDLHDEQQSRQDEEIDRLRTGIRRLNEELQWFLSDSYIDPWIRAGNLSQTKAKKGASPNNKEQQSLSTTYSNVVVRDMIGARASTVEVVPVLSFSSSYGETPPGSPPQPLLSQGRAHAKPPRSSDGLHMSYSEIFRILVGQGLITPVPSDTVESFLQSDTAHLPSCEYHKGHRGHSTENCIQLRFQVQKLMSDGLLKIEPPKLVVADQNNSFVPNSDNISSDPESLLVFNGKETGHSIVKAEYDRILQEMNFSDDQLFRRQKEERNTPQEQISKKHEQAELLKKASFDVSNEEQTVPKEEYDRVFQEMNSLKNQLIQISSEVNSLNHMSEKQEQVYLSNAGFQVSNKEQFDQNSSANELDMKRAGQNSSTEEQSLQATCSNILNKYKNGEKALFSLNSVPLALFLFYCFMVFWLCVKVGVTMRAYFA